jgi:hypothetical protein
MNALEGIRETIKVLADRGVIPEHVVTHPEWTTRGYIFAIEQDFKIYISVNRKDLDIAVAQLIAKGEEEDLADYMNGIRILEDVKEFQKVSGGFYIWTLELQ